MTSDFLTTYWPLILGGVLVVLAIILLLTRRGQRVELGSIDPVIAPTLARITPVEIAAPPLAKTLAPVPVLAGAPDDLRTIKGLGPKVAAQLTELGVTRFEQLAALNPAQQAALDAQLGPFAGRMARDRWVEQARLLASGDVAVFEAQFGKLG